MLGILTINIGGFAGPMASAISPHLPWPTSPIQEASYAFNLLFFEGKMRALFCMLFGASLVLFWERTEAKGYNGDVLQLRRLGWLLIFGSLHYFLFWWGDILFIYALCGIVALPLRQLNNGVLLTISLGMYYGWHVWGSLDASAAIHAESAVRAGNASLAQKQIVSDFLSPIYAWSEQELHEAKLSFLDLALTKVIERPFWQLDMTAGTFAEALPLMLIGMVLYRQGFFSGKIGRRQMLQITIACSFAGFALTAGYVAWSWPRGFPPVAMSAALSWGLAMPHVLTACGYAGVLVLLTPKVVKTQIGHCLVSAGRMAFSNYILTSILMTFCFYGWGLGLFGQIRPLGQWIFVLGVWAIILTWSPLWLRSYKQGPLEWVWRGLTQYKWDANRRPSTTK